MPRVHLPEDRQQRLVRQQRLPERLDPGGLGEAAGDVLAELVAEDPLPGVELVDRRDRRFLEVDEPVEGRVPPELLDRQADGVDPGLGGGLLEVGHRHVVLTGGVGLRPAEVHLAPGELVGDLAPALDELLVQRVPLVLVGIGVLEPVPLADARLEQRGGGCRALYSINFAGRAVVAEVEAAVEVRVAAATRRPPPGLQHHSGRAKSRKHSVVTTRSTASRHIECGGSTSASSERTSGGVEDVVHRLVPSGAPFRPAAGVPRTRACSTTFDCQSGRGPDLSRRTVHRSSRWSSSEGPEPQLPLELPEPELPLELPELPELLPLLELPRARGRRG